MKIFFNFGEKVDEFDFKVINERDARASAGIMFLFGLLSLFSVFQFRTLFWAELFTVTFILEFAVRIIFSPKYAPYMVISSLIVSNQEPEWVEAKPKQFAWALGFVLGVIMAYYIVFSIMDPTRLIICLICLVLLFTESVFGVCLGCIIYKKLNIKLQRCPGGVCGITKKRDKRIGEKLIVMLISIIIFYGFFYTLDKYKYNNYATNLFKPSQFELELREFDDVEYAEEDDEEEVQVPKQEECNPPKWAIEMGHREMWIEHNCNK